MTIHVLVPVFNRLVMTQTLLECLRAQIVDEDVTITVVDDGSTDGTGEFLSRQSDVSVLRGHGSLWWGGAIDVGLRHIFASAKSTDWVVFVNNDTRMNSDFLQGLLTIARKRIPAAVGCVVRRMSPPNDLLSIGPRIDPWRMTLADVLADGNPGDSFPDGIAAVDALSGRGVLYPVNALRAVGGMRPIWLPHYLADYEISLRVKSAGWNLLVSTDHAVYSTEEFGSSLRINNLRDRFFAVRSPSYLPALIRFWWGASNLWQRLTLPVRLPLILLFPNLRKKHENRSS